MEMLPVPYSSALGPRWADNMRLWVTLGILAHSGHWRGLTGQAAHRRYTAQYNALQCSRDTTIPLQPCYGFLDPGPAGCPRFSRTTLTCQARRPSWFSNVVLPSTRDGGRTPRRTQRPLHSDVQTKRMLVFVSIWIMTGSHRMLVGNTAFSVHRFHAIGWNIPHKS